MTLTTTRKQRDRLPPVHPGEILLEEFLKPEGSLEPTPDDPDIEELWAEEAERRWREIESGAVATIPWEDVRAKLLGR